MRNSLPIPEMRPERSAFTLVELLVVIGIIALLISILLPSLVSARESAATVKSLSNLRQLGIGLTLYVNDNGGLYPVHSSLSTTVPRTRWADSIFPYMRNSEIYMSPLLGDDERQRMNKPFAHTLDQTTGAVIPGQTITYGGYGYNYQYLGNARQPGGIPPFHANASQIKAASQTIAVADTHGSQIGWENGEGVYVVDPPLMSVELGSKGSRRSSPTPGAGQYGYPGGNDGQAEYRAMPAERNRGKVNVVFCDGHAESMTLHELDHFGGSAEPNNGYWNGRADPTRR